MINRHVGSILNAGTVLVLNLTLGTLLSYDVLVLTRMNGHVEVVIHSFAGRCICLNDYGLTALNR
jgi:hypothetical protein